MMKTNTPSKVLALFVADLHLSLTPPPFRSAESDWLAAQQRPLDELTSLQEKHNGAPIFCAGDIFDKWYVTHDKSRGASELINWAMEHLPYMHCIPGQHDLPEHDLEQIERSAYWTLVKASVINNLPRVNGFTSHQWPGLVLHSFPFGTKVTSRENLTGRDIRIALIHEYNWIDGHIYNVQSSERLALGGKHVNKDRKEFDGYDLVVSGDNHNPFHCVIGKTQFWNCGTFMRRKSDERDYRPQIGMLMSDGSMKAHYLDTSQDKCLDVAEAEELEKIPDMDLSDLIEGLGQLGECALDFGDAMKRQLARNPANKRVRSILWKAIES
jgi:predicted phosphodiesterase